MVMLEACLFFHYAYHVLLTRLFQTLTGKIPFWYMIDVQAVLGVAYRNEKPKQNLYPSFPYDQGCWDIMRRCWHGDPSQREKMPGLMQSLKDLT